MLFSIITVTYNAEKTIEKTLESLASQTFSDYELIVIDGKSEDGTLDKVSLFSNRICNISIFSEKDTGIYNAMNKGVSKAKGEYIYFLNSGDFFVNREVLENVAKYIMCYTDKNDVQKVVFHGKIIRGGKEREYPKRYTKWKWIYLEHAYFSHQAIFASKETMTPSPFDESFRICADRDWFIRMMDNNCVYVYMNDIVVANYADGGVSSNFSKMMEESLKISRRYGGIKAYLFVIMKRKIGELLGHER